jgi:hypothetical protein
MRRVIVPLKDFNQALAALDPHVPRALLRDVACRLADAPDSVPAVAGSEMRALHTRAYGEYPAFSLFYKFDDRTVYLAHIELRDELEAYDDVEVWGEERV